MSNELVPYEERVGALTPSDVRAQVNLVQHIMREVMKKDEHYGIIPGTKKPTLLKPGAEKLCLTFRLDPQYEIEKQMEGAHLTITSKCTLYHIPTGRRYASGMGSCSTKESKYAYRQSVVKCPHCGEEAIIKGKDFKGDGKPTGWICFAKKGGCGSRFLDGDQAIESQPRGRVTNEDLSDQYNTVLKMANKRSLVAAVLNATAASDIFTQDIEDMPQFSAKVEKVEKDEDITLQMPGEPNAPVEPSPSAAQSPGAPSSPSPDQGAHGSFITAEQAADLKAKLSACDKFAEEQFLKVAKVASIDKLLADIMGSDTYAEALDWIARRKVRLAKPA